MRAARKRNRSRNARFVAVGARAGEPRLRWAAAAVACVAAALGPSPAPAATPSAPDAGAYTANGPVHAITRSGGRTYIGGDFTRVGVRSGSGAILSPTDGSRQMFPEVAGGDVRAVVSDGRGGWYIGGTFTTVGGAPHVGLARLKNENGTVTVDPTFNAAATDSGGRPAAVNALAYSSNLEWPDHETLYVGGEFSRISVPGRVEAHGRIAALDVSTGATEDGSNGRPITAWGPATNCATPPSCSATVRALAVVHVPLAVGTGTQHVPVVFVGGDFARAGATDDPKPAQGLAAIWGVGAVNRDNVSIAGSLVTDSISAPGDNAWAGAPPLPSGAVVRALQVTAEPSTSLAVYIGGSSGANPLLEARQFKINEPSSRNVSNRGSKFTNWRPDPRGCAVPGCVPSVNALALRDSTLYFAGDFSRINSPPPGTTGDDAERVATVETVPDPASVTAMPIRKAAALGAADGPVRTLALSSNGSPLYLGGDFSQRLAALDASGSPTGWAPAPDAPVEALATDPSTPSVYAGGQFSSVGSVARAGLAAFDATGALSDWSPGVTSSPGSSPLVRALAASDSRVYVGGRFDAVGRFDAAGNPQGNMHAYANLAAVDTALGAPIDSFHPAPSGGSAQVLSLSLLDSTLYAGGAFDGIGGQARANLAALDTESGAATGWDPGTNGNVNALVPACGAVYAGGAFTRAGGGGAQERNYIAALDPATGRATGWNPDGADAPVLSLAKFGPTIYAGGNFAHIGGQLRQKIAALDAIDGTVEAFDPNASGPVRAIASNGSAVYAGGPFAAIGGANRANLAAIDPASGDATAWDPSPDAGVRALAVAGDNVYAGGGFGSVGTVQQQGFAPFTAGPGETPAAPPCTLPQALQPEEPPALPPAPPATPSPPTPPPACVAAVSRLTVTPRRLTVRPRRVRRRGRPLTLRYRLSCAARVRLRFERRVMRRCPKARRRAQQRRRRCARYRRFATVRRGGSQGANRLAFARQRVGRHRVVPGRYRVTLRIVPARSDARAHRAHFTAVARRRR